VVREYDPELDIHATWFMMPLRWHTLTVYDLNVVMSDNLAGNKIYEQGSVIQVLD